jgi:formamidopyrimidine-DNA glycosylase
MPELPEVETIRRQLEKEIVGKKLKNREVTKVRRRAKILMIDFADGGSLAFHLKLTGQLIFNGQPSRHTRKVFNFTDGSHLIFNDLRKFGWVKELKETKTLENQFGPEALDLNIKIFEKLLVKHPRSKIKPLLMDQKVIAGIGNIYSDEILFASLVCPLRLAGNLTKKEKKGIFKSTKEILKKAIKYHGSSVNDYLDTLGQKGSYSKYHRVYGREGKKCFRCAGIIKRIKIGGRSAHFCSKCQK